MSDFQLFTLLFLIFIVLAKYMLVGRFGFDVELTIGFKNTKVKDTGNGRIFSIDNKISIQIIDGKEQIYAIGGPKDWAKGAPNHMPEDVNTFDLIKQVNSVWWGSFIKYCRFKNAVDNKRVFLSLRFWAKSVKVKIVIDDVSKSEELVKAIHQNNVVSNIKVIKS